MIKRELYMTREDGVNLFVTKSTEGLKIRKLGTNEVYEEAVDIETAGYLYEETDIPIEVEV